MGAAENNTRTSELERLREKVADLEGELARARAEGQRLREQGQWRAIFLQQTPLAAITWDLDFRVREWNPAAERMFGYRRSDALGRHVGELLVPPELLDTAAARFRAVVEERQGHEHLMECVTRERGRIECQWYCAPIVDAGSNVIGVASLAHDVTERNRFEQMLKKSEAHLRLVVNQVPAIVWTTDAQLRITSNQGAALAPLNLAGNQLVGAFLSDYLGTRDPDFPAMGAHYKALAGESVNYEQEWQGQYYECRAEPLKGPDGSTQGVIGVAFDVTGRKQAEEAIRRARDELEGRVRQRTAELNAMNARLEADIAKREAVEMELRASEERFRLITEASPIGVGIVGLEDGRLLYANRRMADIFGYAGQDLSGRPANDFFAQPEEQTLFMAALARDGHLWDREVTGRRGDGTQVALSVSAVMIDYKGKPAALAGMIDVSERRRAEEALHAERRLLRQLLNLHQRDRQLIGYEIHDGIVQDMTGAIFYLEAALESIGRNDDEARRHVEEVLRLLRANVDEARRLISGLSPPVLDESGVIAAVQNLAAEVTARGAIEVEFAHDVRFDRIVPTLEMAIYRIVQEALTNAQRHSGSSRARVEITQHGERVSITVQDWGVGFDRDQVNKKKRYGLAGLRERARLLGGAATIETAAGRGTTIRVDLPLVDVLLPIDPSAGHDESITNPTLGS